jgi:hypothetical protein
MARRKSQTYSGALRIPIKYLDKDEFKRELLHKFVLLVKHYKIDPDLPPEQLLFSLAVQLAFDHVRGFQMAAPKRVGRFKKWDLNEARRLVAAVDAHKSKGIKAAIRLVTMQKDRQWGQHIPSIETRYYEAKRQIALRICELSRLLGAATTGNERHPFGSSRYEKADAVNFVAL